MFKIEEHNEIEEVPEEIEEVPEETEEIEETTELNKLLVKRTPMDFVKALKLLNQEQKEGVRRVGFGTLLDYNLCSVPNALAYWILDNFNPYSRELKLPSGKCIHIVDRDVE